MLGRLGKDAGSLLGIEITPPFIRLVRLRRHRGRYSVQAWALEPLPVTAMHNGWIADPEQVGAALLQVVRRSAGSVRRAAIALPAGLVIEKLLSMPADLDDEAIIERLPADAGQFVPFALEDAAVDFQVMGPDPDASQHQRVVVAACHLALLDVLQASLETAGVRACVVEPDSHALQRALQVDGLLLQAEADVLVIHEWGEGPVSMRREVRMPAPGTLCSAWQRRWITTCCPVRGGHCQISCCWRGPLRWIRTCPGNCSSTSALRCGMPTHSSICCWRRVCSPAF